MHAAMNRFVRPCALLLLIATPFAAAVPATEPGSLTVIVGNIRGATGAVHVDLCSERKFITENCEVSTKTPAQYGETTVTLKGLRPGHYAVQAIYDENGNGKQDFNFIGMPREGFGFSRDAKVRLGPPRWADAVFDFDGKPQTIRLKMRYMLGPKGPDDKKS